MACQADLARKLRARRLAARLDDSGHFASVDRRLQPHCRLSVAFSNNALILLAFHFKHNKFTFSPGNARDVLLYSNNLINPLLAARRDTPRAVHARAGQRDDPIGRHSPRPSPGTLANQLQRNMHGVLPGTRRKLAL